MARNFDALKIIIAKDYERHVAKFETLEKANEILLLGDSMAAYFPTKAFHLEDKITNFGIPGDTTIGVLNRVKQTIKLKPNVVVLNIGLNDFVLTELTQKETLENILTIRHQILEGSPNTKIFIVSLTPINQKGFPDQLYLLNRDPNDARQLNETLRKVIDPQFFINVHPFLTDEEGNLKLEWTRDGIHLNQAGYQIYFEKIQEKLDEQER
ncbi:MAG: GDSL-type esterase/lipase family protein [Acholeplasmataceae bacterium]|nr:GDSL-type esterase/lipase family protein [Acholeplasmataceae bacterium]